MKISTEQVQHVAKLARLEIDPAAIDKLSQQLAAILEYVDKLGEVDTQGVPPTSHAIDLTNAFRSDQVHDHLSPEAALQNAPAKEDDGFVVPKII